MGWLLVTTMALTNAEKQARGRERHAMKRYAVQRISKAILRRQWSDDTIPELASALRSVLNTAGIWKPWRVTRGHAQSVQQALSTRSSGGLAAAWARGVQAGAAGEPGELLEGLRNAGG